MISLTAERQDYAISALEACYERHMYVNFFETAVHVLPHTFAIAIVVPSSFTIFPLKLKNGILMMHCIITRNGRCMWDEGYGRGVTHFAFGFAGVGI